MDYKQEVEKFTAHAQSKRMDVTGDAERFYKTKTARAWTKWIQKRRAEFNALTAKSQPRALPIG